MEPPKDSPEIGHKCDALHLAERMGLLKGWFDRKAGRGGGMAPQFQHSGNCKVILRMLHERLPERVKYADRIKKQTKERE